MVGGSGAGRRWSIGRGGRLGSRAEDERRRDLEARRAARLRTRPPSPRRDRRGAAAAELRDQRVLRLVPDPLATRVAGGQVLLDLVHLRLVEPALGIGRQAVGRGVDGLDIRHRNDSADREARRRRRFRPQIGGRRSCLAPRLSVRMPAGDNPFKGREELIDEPFGIAAQVAQDA